MPSKKSLKKARDAIREKTGKSKCYKPTPKVIEDLNLNPVIDVRLRW